MHVQLFLLRKTTCSTVRVQQYWDNFVFCTKSPALNDILSWEIDVVGVERFASWNRWGNMVACWSSNLEGHLLLVHIGLRECWTSAVVLSVTPYPWLVHLPCCQKHRRACTVVADNFRMCTSFLRVEMDEPFLMSSRQAVAWATIICLLTWCHAVNDPTLPVSRHHSSNDKLMTILNWLLHKHKPQLFCHCNLSLIMFFI